ncbi:MAG: slipin family protein [Bacteroidota bacterium]
MFRVKVKTYEKGLLFKGQDLIKVLNSGTYWIKGNKRVKIYSALERFEAPIDISLLLKNQELYEQLYIVEVSDEQIALLFKNNVFQSVLTEGTYAYWKDHSLYTFKILDMNKLKVEEELSKKVLEYLCYQNIVKKAEVRNFEMALVTKDGELVEVLKAGSYYFFKQLANVQIEVVDLRQQNMELSGQEILTKDKANLRINFECTFKVNDPVVALLKNIDFRKQLYTILQMALRAYVGQLSFDEILALKSEAGNFVKSECKRQCIELGIDLISCGIKDIILPGDIKDIMNQVLVAEKKAAASMIMRREETASTRSMLNTAKLMETNKMLYKLKEMEFVEKVADKVGEITVDGKGSLFGQLKGMLSTPP